MKTKISGASDDLIEIEGVIEDEIGCYNSTKKTIVASDGTVAKIDYNGSWDIEVSKTGPLFERIIKSVGEDVDHTDPDASGCASYSDVLVFKDGIEWVKIGGKTFKP